MSSISKRLIFGCCSLSANKTKNRAFEILKYAKNLGFRYFDTAPLYSKGYSELLIGEAFKNNREIKVITKVGNYSVPKIFIPSSIALPLNILKNNLNLIGPKKFEKVSLESKFIHEKNEDFINQIIKSRKNLKDLNIEGILFHELNPFKLNSKLVEELNQYLINININKLGYAGQFHKEFKDIKIPKWIKILQLEIPIGSNETNELEIFKFIDGNKDKEFRFYNIFKEKELIIKRLNCAKKILLEFPNTKIIFQTTSFKRLKSNYNFFTS